MTYAPASLKALANYWVAQGGVNSGIVGDAAHQRRASYHNGQDAIDKYGRTALDDYSIRHVRDREPYLTNAASAIDLGRLDGSLVALHSFSRWLVAEALQDPEAYRDVREVIYSPDGQTVQRYSGVDGAIHTGPGNGDNSHLWHTHISFFRDSEKRDKRPLFEGYFITPPDTGTEDPVGLAFRFLEAAHGTVTVQGSGHAIIRVVDKGQVSVPDGQQRESFAKVELLEPLDANAGDRKTGFVIGKTPAEPKNYQAAFILASDVTYVAAPQESVPYPVKLSLTVGDKPVAVTTGPLSLP